MSGRDWKQNPTDRWPAQVSRPGRRATVRPDTWKRKSPRQHRPASAWPCTACQAENPGAAANRPRSARPFEDRFLASDPLPKTAARRFDKRQVGCMSRKRDQPLGMSKTAKGQNPMSAAGRRPNSRPSRAGPWVGPGTSPLPLQTAMNDPRRAANLPWPRPPRG
jgi:hypothetical protein